MTTLLSFGKDQGHSHEATRAGKRQSRLTVSSEKQYGVVDVCGDALGGADGANHTEDTQTGEESGTSREFGSHSLLGTLSLYTGGT